jgi:LTXXQ motif family protein
MRRLRLLLLRGSFVIMIGVSTSALAQDMPPSGPPGLPGSFLRPPFPPAPPFGNGGKPQAPAPRDMCLDRIAADAARHAYVAAKLTLTAVQEKLWQPVEAVFEKASAAQRRFCTTLPVTSDLTPPSAPKAVAAEVQITAARLKELQEIQQPFAAFYESLSPEQRAVFDAQPPGWP